MNLRRLVLLLMLLGFAPRGVADANHIDPSELPEVVNRPLYLVQHLPPVFETRSFGKSALFVASVYVVGVIGAAGTSAAATHTGGKKVIEYQIQDPAVEIRTALAIRLSEYLKSPSSHVIEEPLPRWINSDKEIRQVAPEGALVLTVRTNAWGIEYLKSNWPRYKVIYSARARLVDLASGKTVAWAVVPVKEKYSDTDSAPTHDELFADNAKLLKEKLVAKVPLAVEGLFASLTTPRSTTSPSAR